MISNNAGVDGFGLGQLLTTRQIRKMISSYVGENKGIRTPVPGRRTRTEFNPQGTLAEARLRAGGPASPRSSPPPATARSSPTAKETREIDGRHYVLETALRPTSRWSMAWKADKAGNLVFRKTARNFNPMRRPRRR